ncbi:MAG: STT3 domain-containing protein [Candidatus Micrarchaeaceae archaeon]
MEENKIEIAAFIFILLIGLFLRLYPLVRWSGIFAEPDVYIYFSVATQTASHNFSITSLLSGVPPRAYNEFPGLVLFPAYMSAITHISIYNIIYYSPVLMGLLGIIAVYLLARELIQQKRWPALMAAFLYAVLPAVLYRSIAGEYRGEVFVPVFLAFAMLFLIRLNRRNALLYGAGFIALTALSLAWWSGGFYALAAPLLFAISAAVFHFLPKAIKKTANNPILRNRLTNLLIIAVLLCAYPIYTILIPKLQSIAGGYTTFITSDVAELAPTSTGWILSYYNWAYIGAILGLVLLIYFGNWERFHKPYYAILALALPAIIMETFAVRWLILFTVPACILAAYFVYAMFTMLKVWQKRQLFLAIGLCAIAFASGLTFMLAYQPTDYLNSQFLSALAWMKSNTPLNSTILTMWPDGSVVEGWAERQSYTDSIMSQRPDIIVAFEKFLYANAGNYSYVKSIKPSYLLVRQTWKLETIGILAELSYPLNKSINGTNLQQLLNGTAPYPIVFKNNDTIIYKVI